MSALPDVADFQSVRGLSAWLRLPRGRMLRAARNGGAGEDWLWKIIRRKKPRQATIALANRMARTDYALGNNRTKVQLA